MSIQFISRQNASVVPAVATLLCALFFNPAPGKAQNTYTAVFDGKSHGTGNSDMSHIVGQLEQSALLALCGFVVLMIIIYICHVSKACANMNKVQKNTRNLILLVAGLGSFCSSCSVEQRAMAEQYRTVASAENRTCPMNHHYIHQDNPAYNSRFSTNNYANWNSPVFCKHCGQRVFSNR